MSRATQVRHWLKYRFMPVGQVGVWLAAVAAAAGLFQYHSESFSASGVARGRISPLSVTYAARVKSVPVELFQEVTKGEVVAVLDDELLRAQMATLSAEMARLRAEYVENQVALDADVANRLSRWDAENRAFANDLVQLAVGAQELKATLEYDRAMLEGLRAAMLSAQQLVEKGLGPLADLETAKAEYEATARKIAENERLLARLQAERQTAEQRQAAHLQHRPLPPSKDPALGHLREAIAVQEGLVREIEAQRAESVLRAPFDGVVIEIQGRAGDAAIQRPGEGVVRGPGEVVRPGEPIVTIAEHRPTEVIAYADSNQAVKLSPGLEVVLSTSGPKRQNARGAVVAVSPTVQRLPERLWRNADVAEWGRPFLVQIPPGLVLQSGQQVTVSRR